MVLSFDRTVEDIFLVKLCFLFFFVFKRLFGYTRFKNPQKKVQNKKSEGNLDDYICLLDRLLHHYFKTKWVA